MPFSRLGKLQTGNMQPDEFAFYYEGGQGGGLNVKDAPQVIGDGEFSVAVNGYLTPGGAFRMRNGMSLYGPTFGTGSGITCGTRFYQRVKNGAVVSNDFIISSYNGNLYAVPASTSGTATQIAGTYAFGNAFATFVQMQDPNDPNFASGLTDVLVICTGSGGPYVWDGTNLYTPAGWADAAGASWCAQVNGITWFGGIPSYPNQIFGTGDGIVESMETLPAIRNFVMSQPVTGLCAQGTGATATLVIGQEQGISVLYGTGPSTFYLQGIPFQDGVAAGRAMVSANGIMYFLGRNAVYSFDGVDVPQRISDKIEPWILNDPLQNSFTFTQNRYLSWAQVYNNRLHIGYCSDSTVPNNIAVFDLVVGGWTVLQTTPGLSSMFLLNAPDDPSPFTALCGSSLSGQLYTWDYVPTTFTVYDGTTPVIAQVQGKFFKVGQPGTNKTLERFYPEFLVSGVFMGNFTVSTDYGALTSQQVIEMDGGTALTALIWDVGSWNNYVWGGTQTGFTSFNAPATRIDYDGLLGESFAFGFTNATAVAPWVWVGGSGVFSQRSRT